MDFGSSNSPIMKRFLNYPRRPEDATWTCPTCGVIEAKAIAIRGDVRYVHGKCACVLAEEMMREAQAKRQQWMHWQARRTFSWLGDRWQDTSLLDKTFDNFDASMQPEAYETVRSFILEMRGTLVLHGTFGTGKTHLLAALCNEIRTANRSSLFTTAPELFSAIQARLAANEDYSVVLDQAIKTNLLVIDDIDKAKWSEFRESIYFEIVNKRVNSGRPIAISTNRLDKLGEYVGDAVCSRMKIGQIDVEMIGIDYREGMEAS